VILFRRLLRPMDEFLKAAIAEAEAGLAEGAFRLALSSSTGARSSAGATTAACSGAAPPPRGWMPRKTPAGSPAVVYTRSVLHDAVAMRHVLGAILLTASHASLSARTSRPGRKTCCGDRGVGRDVVRTRAASR